MTFVSFPFKFRRIIWNKEIIVKKMSEAKKKRMLDWIKKYPKRNKERRRKPAMTNSYGNVLFNYKSRRNKYGK